MRVLLVQSIRREASDLYNRLACRSGWRVSECPSLRSAAELLRPGRDAFDLLVFDDLTEPAEQWARLLSLNSGLPCIRLVERLDSVPPELRSMNREGFLEILPKGDHPGVALTQLLDRLELEGLFAGSRTSDSEFIKVHTEGLVLRQTLNVDVYIRLGPNRYCRRFRQADGFSAEDLDQWIRNRSINAFYVPKEQIGGLISVQNRLIDTAARENAAPEMRKAAGSSLSLVQDVVKRLGFSAEVQTLARQAVELTLRSIGKVPRLASVLNTLKKHEGRYITSHSLMLAEVACAIAQRAGVANAQTFMKLTMAAILHDLILEDDQLARVRGLSDLGAGGFTVEQAREYRLHPVRAAEYAASFKELPPDVEIILLEHHERPDGTGFPRGLVQKQLHSLSVLFIISHELIHYFLETVPTTDREHMLPSFVADARPRFPEGGKEFDHIWEALLTTAP